MDKNQSRDEQLRSRLRTSGTRADYLGYNLPQKRVQKKSRSSSILRVIRGRLNLLKTRITTTKSSLNFKKSLIKYAGITIFVVVVGVLFRSSWNNTSKDNDNLVVANGENDTSGPQIEVLDKPDFDVLLPAGRSIDSLVNSQTRVTPNKDIIFSFSDYLNDLPIEVTEQKLPENFVSDSQAQLKNIASQFQMGNVISIDGNLTYHGVSEQTGTQSLVTIIDDKLIFLRSPQKLSDDTWAGYIKSFNRGQ